MHTNHRRKNTVRAKHHNNLGYWMRLKHWKPYRKLASKARRAEERELIHHHRWDDLQLRYPRNILWKYW